MILVLMGCESSQPAPRTAKPIEEPATTETLPPVAAPKPEKSDPAALLLVNAILMAHTNNEPALVEKLRKVQIRRKGEWKLPDGSRSEATMDIAIWGDQYRTTFAIAATGNIPETFSINRDKGWRYQSKIAPKEIPLDSATLEAILPEVYGDRMTLLTPLTSPKLIAVIARNGQANGPGNGQGNGQGDGPPESETILRVWIDQEPPMLIHIDPKTNKLRRLTYEMLENGQIVARALRLSEFTNVSGVLLPGRVEYGVGPLTFTTWSKIEYVVPGQFELSFFDKP